jgi:hypothetical protein
MTEEPRGCPTPGACSCVDALAAAMQRADKLQAFKDWVHGYLDSKGVPHHPPGTHGAEGCRIGDRMDWLMQAKERAEGERDTASKLYAQAAMDRDTFCDKVRRLREENERLRGDIQYWSYCIWIGMRQECPENKARYLELCERLDIEPYAAEARALTAANEPRSPPS